jgi:phage gp29-like protein
MQNFLKTWYARFAAEPTTAPQLKASAAPEKADSLGLEECLGRPVTASDVSMAAVAAGDGYPHDQALVFKELIKRDATIAAHLATRRNAVLGLDWNVESKTHPEQAKKIAAGLKAANMRGLIQQLLGAVPFGYAGAVLDWDEGGAALKGWRPAAPHAFEFDAAGNAAFVTINAEHLPVAPLVAAGSAVYVASDGFGLPSERGLLGPLAWLYLLKTVNFKNWGRYVERFGIPVAVVTATSRYDETTANAIISKLKSAGASAALVAGDETKINFAGASTGSTEAFATFVKHIDDCIATLILGQTATTKEASGFSNGGAQAAVRDDLAAADAQLVNSAIQQQIVAPWLRFAFGLPPDAAEFWLDYAQKEDEKAKAETWKILTEVTGRKIDVDLAAEHFGVRFQDEPAPAQPLTDQRATLALADSREPRDRRGAALQAIVNDALLATVEDEQTAAEWFGPLRHAVREAFADLDPDNPDAMAEFRRRLPVFMAKIPGLYAEMDSAAFERHLAGAMLAAAVNGYAG